MPLTVRGDRFDNAAREFTACLPPHHADVAAGQVSEEAGAKKKRREAGEVASRRAEANTGNCSQLLCEEQSSCQTNKTN